MAERDIPQDTDHGNLSVFSAHRQGKFTAHRHLPLFPPCQQHAFSFLCIRQIPLEQTPSGPSELLCIVGQNRKQRLLSVKLRRHLRISSAKSPFDARMLLQLLCQFCRNGIRIIGGKGIEIRCLRPQRHDRMMHEIDCRAKSEKENDAESKGTRHQKEILPAARRMVHAQRRIYLKDSRAGRSFCRLHRTRIAGHCRQGRYARRLFCRRSGRQKHRNKTDQRPCHQT